MDSNEYRVVTGEALDAVHADAQDVVRFAKQSFDVDLRFDDRSIMWLSSFIENNRDSMTEELKRTYSMKIGIFLGESIIAAHGGRWVLTKDRTLAIQFDTGAIAFPLNKSQKQMQNRIEDNIYGLYRSIGRLLKGNLPNQQVDSTRP